jgi:hypothetical protein
LQFSRWRRERYDEVIGIIKDYVTVCGEIALGWELESELLFKLKQYDDAFAVLRRGVEVSPHSLIANYELGRGALERG